MLAVAVAAFWVVALLQTTPVDATSHRAVRSFSASWVLPDGRLEVTITPTGYGSIGQVVETLPAGFSYSGSDPSEPQVAADGRTVTFTLLGEETSCVHRDGPCRRRFLRILRDHQGRGQIGGIGSWRFQHTGRPPANPGAYADGRGGVSRRWAARHPVAHPSRGTLRRSPCHLLLSPQQALANAPASARVGHRRSIEGLGSGSGSPRG